jgi:hypothetical protein
MKKMYLYGPILLLITSCGIATDPKIYEDVVGLVEEVVKDEMK